MCSLTNTPSLFAGPFSKVQCGPCLHINVAWYSKTTSRALYTYSTHIKHLGTYSSFMNMVALSQLLLLVLTATTTALTSVDDDAFLLSLAKRQRPGTDKYNCHNNCGTYLVPTSSSPSILYKLLLYQPNPEPSPTDSLSSAY